jgi:gamma-glutamyl phosphate reductase
MNQTAKPVNLPATLRSRGARGPMGLDELTSYKWLDLGNGQVRS